MPFRLTRADFLKLRKRRGVAITAAVLTVGLVVVVFTIIEIAHLANPDKNGVAGGMENFKGATTTLWSLGAVLTGILIGTAAGSMDRNARVWRDLVMTGRPRQSLYFARLPGSLLLLLPLLGIAFLITAVICVTAASDGGVSGDDQSAPSWALVGKSALWLGWNAVVFVSIGIGLASLFRSRAAAIIVSLAWLLPGEHLLEQISFLGGLRAALLSPAAQRLAPAALDTRDDTYSISFGAAFLVTLGWIVIPLLLGLWRDLTTDA
jgi:hypothetical protein